MVGAYFVWFWTHGGQTLPMKTWRLRGRRAQTARPVNRRARSPATCSRGCGSCRRSRCIRCFALAVPQTLAVIAAWFVLWAAAVWLDPARQFLHDRLAGTRIVTRCSAAAK